jgi:hypothetical protein
MTPRRLAPFRMKAPLWASRLGGALMPWACARTSHPSQETGRLDALSVCNYVGCFWRVNVISYWHLWFKLYNLFPSSKELINFSCEFITFIYLYYSRLATFVALITKFKKHTSNMYSPYTRVCPCVCFNLKNAKWIFMLFDITQF